MSSKVMVVTLAGGNEGSGDFSEGTRVANDYIFLSDCLSTFIFGGWRLLSGDENFLGILC